MLVRSAHMLSTVKVADIASDVTCVSCGDCNEIITATVDDDGTWIECDCDSGYAPKTIKAIVLY